MKILGWLRSPLRVALALSVFALAGCGGGSDKGDDWAWVKADSPEFRERVKLCHDLGQQPIVEMWRGAVRVAGCK